LYNSVFNSSITYPVCGGSGARIAHHNANITLQNHWEIRLHPNPATTAINIESNMEDDKIHLDICDLSGRKLLGKDLKLKGFNATLDLNLINGVYLVTITNSSNERLNKKLLISR